MNGTDKSIHDLYHAFKTNDIKWNNFPNIGLCESYYLWYYAEDRLYIIRDCMTDGFYMVEARSPIKAFKALYDRIEEARHAGEPCEEEYE